MSLSNRPRMFTRKNKPVGDSRQIGKDFFCPKSSIKPDGDEKSSDDINTDDDDDLDAIRLGKTKKTLLLFVYQNGWQRRLFSRCLKELTLLDATYRTARYALPLFFMVVKTDIDYQIVAVFVTQNETEDSIQEAQLIIKSWNKDVSPIYGVTDYCTEEFKTMENQ